MADLNALIAQGAQFRVPPPVDPMGNMPQLMQMRSAQNQNELAQYQLSSARREDASTNALNMAYQNAYDPVTGKIDSARLLQSLASSGAGSKIPGVQKLLMEAENELLKRDKLKGEIAAQPGAAAHTKAQTTKLTSETTRDELKRAISDISKFDNVTDALKDLDIHERDGKISPEKAAQLRAVLSDPKLSFSKWQRSTLMGLMDEKDRVAATQPKPVAQPLGNRMVYLDMNPDSPTFKQEILPEQKMGAAPSTDAAIMQARAAQQQASTSAGQLGVAQDRLANEGQGVTYIQNADGGYTAVPSRLAPGVAPVSRTVLTAEGVPLIGKDASRTGVSEQQAAYNIGRVLTAANQIKGITGKDPSAMKPGGAEALASSVGLSGTANLARSANRQIVQGAQRDALDALLYLATGAAYNKEQLLGQMEAYIPAFTDTAKTVAAKQTRMADLIQSAKTRAGKAWTPEMDAAMKALMSPSNVTPDAKVMPAPPGVDPALWGAMTPEEQNLWAK